MPREHMINGHPNLESSVMAGIFVADKNQQIKKSDVFPLNLGYYLQWLFQAFVSVMALLDSQGILTLRL